MITFIIRFRTPLSRAYAQDEVMEPNRANKDNNK